jgi:hypothetical protein
VWALCWQNDCRPPAAGAARDSPLHDSRKSAGARGICGLDVPVDRHQLAAGQRQGRCRYIIDAGTDSREGRQNEPDIFCSPLQDLDKQLEAARKAGDMPSMQRLLGDKTLLLRAMYGKLA